ncbi:hypothetical protein CLU79DRAFT_762448 [Phycomyces nitens]|nr:hypothetical protein CLU79DRAFT_762448 [Phycomyces nitens]
MVIYTSVRLDCSVFDSLIIYSILSDLFWLAFNPIRVNQVEYFHLLIISFIKPLCFHSLVSLEYERYFSFLNRCKFPALFERYQSFSACGPMEAMVDSQKDKISTLESCLATRDPVILLVERGSML